MLRRLKNIGPGALVTAAFIGPGTVTTCSIAGATYGYALLWALVFATFATIVLQEMSVRLGTVTHRGLGETLSVLLDCSIWKWPLYLLIIVAIYMGNAAYEAGNLSGAALGASAIFGDDSGIYRGLLVSMSLIAGAFIWFGSYKHIEKALLGLVVLMAIAFILTFAIVKPDVMSIFSGLILNVPGGSLTTIVALIGTTVVPYNLFLHASAAKNRWSGEQDLKEARTDTFVSIGFGGVITILIVSTAASSLFANGIVVAGVADMARQFEPLFGSFSKYLLGLGLFAAGLSSAITAPLATAYAMSEILGIEQAPSSKLFRAIGLSVIAVGVGLSTIGFKPLAIIISAQFANGLLLPIIAGFLLFSMNRKELLGRHINGWRSNILGALVMLISSILGVWSITKLFIF